MQQLLFEARLGGQQRIGTKLTDHFAHRQDLELWRLILDVKRYYQGIDGLRATWHAMGNRGVQVRLDENNATAMGIWDFLTSAAATNDYEFLKRLCRDCIQKGMLESRIFADAVGMLLRHQPKRALEFAAEFQRYAMRSKDELLDLFQIACKSEAEYALQCFCELRRFLCPDIKLYYDTVPYLLEVGRREDALMMHKFLITRHDLPKSFSDIAPFVRLFAETGVGLDSFIYGLRAAGSSFEAQIRRLYARERARVVGFHPEAFNIAASHTLGREPRNLRDETIARALATPGLSFGFALRLMQPFGMIEFGPYSVRQMALTSADSTELRARFNKLEEFGIDLGSSAYVRLVKKLSDMDATELSDLFVQTDMHHEEFEDTNLQKALVEQYLQRHDIQQLSRSLVILNMGEVGDRAQSNAANLVLRNTVDLRDWQAMLQALRVFRERSIRAERSSIRHILQALLSSRHASPAVLPDSDRVGFLVGILQHLLVSGSEVRPNDWIEPLLELGHQGRLKEVERLVLWLAEYYHRPVGNSVPFMEATNDTNLNLSKLFTKKLQVKMISWSFRKQNWKRLLLTTQPSLDGSGTTPWLRMAAVLKTVRDKYGVLIVIPVLTDVYMANIRSLHYSNATSQAVTNKIYTETHSLKLADFMASWMDLWGGDPSASAHSHRSTGSLRAGGRRNLITYQLRAD